MIHERADPSEPLVTNAVALEPSSFGGRASVKVRSFKRCGPSCGHGGKRTQRIEPARFIERHIPEGGEEFEVIATH
jgi:hypothetical protein